MTEKFCFFRQNIIQKSYKLHICMMTKILIIGGIKSSLKYQNRRVIKHEIRKYKSDFKVKYAYQLNIGGLQFI